MGVYNNVEFELPCESCGEPLKDWQTKNATIEVKSKSGRAFYLENNFSSVPIEDIKSGDMCTMCSNKDCLQFAKLVEKEILNGEII